MDEKLLLLGEVAELLHVQPYKIVYLFSAHKIEDVSRLGNRRVFCTDDVSRIAKALGVEWDTRQIQTREESP